MAPRKVSDDAVQGRFVVFRGLAICESSENDSSDSVKTGQSFKFVQHPFNLQGDFSVFRQKNDFAVERRKVSGIGQRAERFQVSADQSAISCASGNDISSEIFAEGISFLKKEISEILKETIAYYREQAKHCND